MLETVLTRIILRYAQRYICDTLRTDSLSLWGGDLRVQNFELRTDELARALGTADSSGLRLTRGFVRELRVVVPWNAIRSQSLRVEVHSVEIIFCSGGPARAELPEELSEQTALPSKESSQESLEETQETWLQPLLRNIFGNLTVSVDNLVAKFVRNGAVACVTVERFDSRPQSSQWEAAFTPLTSQPVLYRVVSVRDATVTLDLQGERRSERRSFGARRGNEKRSTRQVALPILHRVSAEVFVEWPWLPWPTPQELPPTSRLGLHLSPIRARLGSDQMQLLALLAGPEVVGRQASSGGLFEAEADSESDRFSLLSGGGSSRTLGEGKPIPRQLSECHSPRGGERPASSPPTPSKGHTPSKSHMTSTSSLPEEEVPSQAKEPGRGGIGSFLADVLFGDDEEEEAEEEVRDEGANRTSRETRRIVTLATCVPLLAVRLEQATSTPEEVPLSFPPWNAGSAALETRWLGTLSLIGFSAAALCPDASTAEPFEGSLELHHVVLHVPNAEGRVMTALGWGTTLLRDPLEAEEVSSPAVSGSTNSPAGARASSKTSASSLTRAATWIEAGRRMVREFPPPSHDVLGISGALVISSLGGKAEKGIAQEGRAAVRMGFLIVPPEFLQPRWATAKAASDEGASSDEDSEVELSEIEGSSAPSLWRVSLQLAEPHLVLEKSWCSAMKGMLQPLLQPSSGPTAPLREPSNTADSSSKITQAVFCCSGLSVRLSSFEFQVGPLRGEWREKRLELQEARLAASLQETTVFLSSALPHWPNAELLDSDTSLAQLDISSWALRGCDMTGAAAEAGAFAEFQGFSVVSSLESESITHVEARLESLALRLAEDPLNTLRRSLEALVESGGEDAGHQLGLPGPFFHFEVKDLEMGLHLVESPLDLERDLCSTPRPSRTEDPPPWATSDSEAEEAAPESSGAAASSGAAGVTKAQLLFALKQVALTYQEVGKSHVVLGGCDLGPVEKEVEQSLARVADKAKSPLSSWSRRLPDTAVWFACQLVPAGLPRVSFRPTTWLVVGHLAQVLPANGSAVVAFLHAHHLALRGDAVSLAMGLANAASPSSVEMEGCSASTETLQTTQANDEWMASLSLAAPEMLLLPCSVFLLEPDDTATACLTTPLVLAMDPSIQVQGMRFTVFDERDQVHPVSELKRCLATCLRSEQELAEEQLEEVSPAMSLARASMQVWRSETLAASAGERPLVTVDVNLTLTPWKFRLQAVQLRALQEWAGRVKFAEEAERSGRPTPLPRGTATEAAAVPSLARAGRVRLGVSLRATGRLELAVACQGTQSLHFLLPSLSATFRQLEDHFSARVRLARPYLSLNNQETDTADAVPIVEWCEEKVGEEPRKRAWLRALLTQRGDQPLSIFCSSLPIGLCVAATPLFNFAAAFLKESRCRTQRPLPTQAPTAAPPVAEVAPVAQLQVELGTVSLRLFAGPTGSVSPTETGSAAFLVACLTEASLRVAGASLEGEAILSLSLFEQRPTEGDDRKTCLVDDLVAPCSVRLLPILRTDSSTEVVGQRLVLDTISVDLGKSTHFCQLLRLGKECAAAAAVLSEPAEARPSPEPVEGGDARILRGEEMIVDIKLLTLKIPAKEEQQSSVSARDISCSTTSCGPQLSCKELSCFLLGRHRIDATGCLLSLGADLEVSAEAMALQLITGRFFPDLRSSWPLEPEAEASGPSTSEDSGEKDSKGSTRLRIGVLDMTLQPALSAQRHLAVKCQEFFINVLPSVSHSHPSEPIHVQRILFGVEALSMVAHDARIATAPLLSPMELEGKMASFSALPWRPSRTELQLLSGSSVRILAGAWQMGLLIDVCSFRDPDCKVQPEMPEELPTEVEREPEADLEPSSERLLVELVEARSHLAPEVSSAEITDDTLPLRWRGSRPCQLKVNQSRAEDLEVWQAAHLAVDGKEEHYILRLDGPSRLSDVYVFPGSSERAKRLHPLIDYEVDAYDDAQGQFVAVLGDTAEGHQHGEAMLERLAQSSHLLRLRLRQRIQCANFLIELEAMCSGSSELAVAVSTPRLTWSVCHAGVFLAAPRCAAPALEETFGDISFLGVHLGVWQGAQGMAIGARAQSVGVDFYEMSTLSLVPLVLPEENFIHFSMRMSQAERPEHVALRTGDLARRGQTLDVDLGAWRCMTLPWAMARLVEMGSSLAQMGGECTTSPCFSHRQAVVVRNALPRQLVFGQPGCEVLELQSGQSRGYAWYYEHRQLSFGLDQDTLSQPLSLEHIETGTTRWATLEVPGLWKLCVCVHRPSCAQLRIEILPPVLLRSELGYGLDFRFSSSGSPAEPDEERSPESSRSPTTTSWSEGLCYGSTQILQEALFTQDLPLAEQLTRATERDETIDRPDRLNPGRLLGFCAAGRLQLRRTSVEDWSVELPINHEVPSLPPFTTMLTLGVQDGAESVLCTGHDLYGVPRERREASATDLAAPGEAVALPQVLWLRPLILFSNQTRWCLNLLAAPLRITAGPGQQSASHGLADPRQLRHLELQVLPENDAESKEEGLVFSSGPLLVSGLTQFSNVEANELVSWRNAVRCSRGEDMAFAELHLLLEIRRWRQSGLLREVIAEPMWQVTNESGSEILFGLPRGEPSMPEGHVILHRASCGPTWTAALGALQHDPSFPLNACFGVVDRHGTTLWTAASCSMGQTTLVEILTEEGNCFRLLVSVDVRKRGDAVNGGVLVTLFSGAYLRNELPFPVLIQLGESQDGGICLPADSPLQPCPWTTEGVVTSLEEHEEHEEVEESESKKEKIGAAASRLGMRLKVQEEGSKWCDELILEMAPCRTVAGSGSGTTKAQEPAYKTLNDLLSSEWSGERRDQYLELVSSGPRSSCIFNVAYRLKSYALTIAVCPSEAPLVCRNFSCRTVWISEAWCGPRRSSFTWYRMAPGKTRELPCSLLRTFEVFPNAELSSPRESREVVYARLSLDPEALEDETEDGEWHIDVTLAEDSDRYWQPPVAPGVAAADVPPLMLCLRSASGVTSVELRDDRLSPVSPGGVPTGQVPPPSPKRSEALLPSLDVQLQVKDLALRMTPSSAPTRALAVHVQNLLLGFRKEVEEEVENSRVAARRQIFRFQSSLLSVAEFTGSGRLQQVLSVPPVSALACLYDPPFASSAWELIKVDLSPADSSQDDESLAVRVNLQDGLLELVQALAKDFGEEFAIGAQTETETTEQLRPLSEEFKCISLGELYLPPTPICADLRLSAPVFVSFTGLSLTFPEIRLANVTTTRTKLGQELIAHCIAFLLLNSPVLLGSCDLFGNPVQAYRHLRSGLGDLVQRPLGGGLGSLARHTASASLLSLAALCDSLRQNLPTKVPASYSEGSSSSNGLSVGVKALLDGLGRGLSGMVRWEQHTPLPERSGTLGALRGARNAVAGAVAHPVGGFLDFLTAASRTWSDQDTASQGHPADCQACLGFWPIRPSPDVSPAKYYQCCQAPSLDAILFWSPRCELVCLDGEAPRNQEPNLRLLPAGVLLTTEQLHVLVEGAVHILKLREVRAVEAAEPSALITVSSAGIWQLRVREEDERGDLLKHLLRARREAVLPSQV